jgi:hypothetical protein
LLLDCFASLAMTVNTSARIEVKLAALHPPPPYIALKAAPRRSAAWHDRASTSPK